MRSCLNLVIFLLMPVLAAAQTASVSKVRASQRAGTKLVDLYYDLAGAPDSATVEIAISDDGGDTFDLPAASLSGAVGSGVTNGSNKHVVWNAGLDWNGQFSEKVKFRITASAASPPAPGGAVLIPAGSFIMGGKSDDTDLGSAPPVSVEVSAFYMDKHEVTKALWSEVRAWGLSNGYTDIAPGGGKAANHPVHSVTWWDVVKWCNARTQKEGGGLTPVYFSGGLILKTGTGAPTMDTTATGYRLPTEAEWEKAARGGLSGRRFPWGDTISHSQANYYSSTDYSYDVSPTRGAHPTFADFNTPYTSPVGSFAANGYGLHDMAGNVWEWCWDWYSGFYYEDGAVDPQGPEFGSERVSRGGSWVNNGEGGAGCRTAIRGFSVPEDKEYHSGFRTVRSSLP